MYIRSSAIQFKIGSNRTKLFQLLRIMLNKSKIKSTYMIYFSGALIIFSLLISSCSTRAIHDKYFGATEQRLVTHSIDKAVTMLPEKDFMPLKGNKLYLECHFIENNSALEYAKKRFSLELIEKYNITLVSEPDSADKSLYVFFNAIGTDQDDFGLKTPEFVLPGFGGSASIPILALDMFHGVSELYYFIHDEKDALVVRGDMIRSIIRTDKLSLPIISIPINTLD